MSDVRIQDMRDEVRDCQYCDTVKAGLCDIHDRIALLLSRIKDLETKCIAPDKNKCLLHRKNPKCSWQVDGTWAPDAK